MNRPKYSSLTPGGVPALSRDPLGKLENGLGGQLVGDRRAAGATIIIKGGQPVQPEVKITSWTRFECRQLPQTQVRFPIRQSRESSEERENSWRFCREQRAARAQLFRQPRP